MNQLLSRYRNRYLPPCIALAALINLSSGCGPNYQQLRREGQSAMLQGMYGPARYYFEEAERARPRRLQNLHDLAICSVMMAKHRFAEMNHAAAMRELDNAIGYYNQALDVFPGHQASHEGKTIALKLKGQFDEALKAAHWAAEFVGPSAQQYVFLARELEERRDLEGALLRYRQAVAVEPRNAGAHREFAKFLIRHRKEDAAVHHLQISYRLDPRDQWVVDELAARGALPTLVPGAAPNSEPGPATVGG